MQAINDWRSAALAVGIAAAAGFYIYRMLMRMHDRSAGDGDSDGRLLWDLAVIAGLVLLTIREIKLSCVPLLYR